MKPTRKLSRRSFFAAVAGGVATASLIGVVGTEEAQAQSGCSDSDSGRYGDPGGNGRRCRSGYGRRRTGCTDRDTGRGSDGVGYGRRCGSGYRPRCSDSDSGRYGDPSGRGRRCGRRRSCSDSDSGRYGDPGGRGRRC
jgi:hypothetical protein